ncbi:MAG: hypothetical protein Ct9H300mP11_16990 [Chloroflexota bacterium]|nr:MAG: hypothetical protein Ct9H300mP11_16990 [Chloroflexota bacterium]
MTLLHIPLPRRWQHLENDGHQLGGIPHITTYMAPTGKRVIGMAFDPSNTQDIYAAIEVGGLLASRDGERLGLGD